MKMVEQWYETMATSEGSGKPESTKGAAVGDRTDIPPDQPRSDSIFVEKPVPLPPAPAPLLPPEQPADLAVAGAYDAPVGSAPPRLLLLLPSTATHFTTAANVNALPF